MKRCLLHCRGSHGEACRPPNNVRPKSFQLIDCKTRKLISAPKHGYKYAALSYVRGPAQDNESSAKDPGFAPTILDSIDVCLKLDLDYLWIDKYCINQSDPDDKRYQISQMGLIYSNATITIIAAAGTDPSYGLPGVGSTSRHPHPSLSIGQFRILSTLPPSDRSINRPKWATRGWTYQEHMLARRKLIFTDDQILFECRGMSCVESKPFSVHYPGPRDVPASLSGGRKNPMQEPWNITHYLNNFNARDLTYASDALNAMEGIFRECERGSVPLYHILGVPILSPYSYFKLASGKPIPAATPMVRFIEGLLWITTKNHPERRRPGFPSWTWATWRSTKLQNGFLGSWGDPIIEWYWQTDLTRGPVQHARVWLEDQNRSMLQFPDFQNRQEFPHFIQRARDATTLHIFADTFQCSIGRSKLPSASVRSQKQGVDWIRLILADSEWLYTEFWSDEDTSLSSQDQTSLNKAYTGAILKRDGYGQIYLLVVMEDANGVAKRVGWASIDRFEL